MSPHFTRTVEQIQAAISDHDLHTFEGWTAAAEALLKGAPDWTAIKDADNGYTVIVDGFVYAIAAVEGGDAAIYDPDLLIDFDRSAWNVELGGWEGEQAPVSCLENPVFVTLRHE